jgi:uncharacterized protein (DUF736 family)
VCCGPSPTPSRERDGDPELGAGPSSARLIDRLSRPHRAASHQLKEVFMAQIGSFTRGENGVYTGEIRTLTLRVKASIRPCERDNEKSPDHRVSASGVEFGAAWTKAARETGAEYLSLKLDDPSFPAPIYATLTQGDDGEHKLIWSR